VRVGSHEQLELCDGWEAAACAPDAHAAPSELAQLEWVPARVPGTAAAALLQAGLWDQFEHRDFDAEDWWFRTRFQAPPAADGEQVVLELGGIATVAEVFLNGALVLSSETMFAAHELDVGALLAGENELAIRCRALAPILAQRRKPRARWRTRLVANNLRFIRTMALGRAPGFAPGPAAVGPWRALRLVRRRNLRVEELRLRPSLDGDGPHTDGVLAVHAQLRSLDAGSIDSVELELSGPSGSHRAALGLEHSGSACVASGALRVGAVARWWPHTHGEPALHDVVLHVESSSGSVSLDAGRIGFRSLTPGPVAEHDLERDGLHLHINGTPIFVRGAVWTPADFIGLAPGSARLRAALERVCGAGMNMLRIPATATYESDEFHDLCDELGLLVWQDFMFANLDYPIADEQFRETVENEARTQLGRIAGRPSLAVLCGNSEIEQQVAMLGLDPRLGRGELFGELLPRIVVEARSDAVYVPSAPCGGTLPFRSNRGIANYYGVGGYRRPLEDARRAEVRFAAECLAFSNVPDETAVEAMLPPGAAEVPVHHPRWKAGVPRDAGSGWDFEDVRDHYLRLLFGVDASELRRYDHERYIELSRAVSGEAMAEVFGEWRRTGSPCGGGLVLWLADIMPGAGWGVLDHAGRPKPAYHHLRRALAPVAVWTTDEGLNGICAHVCNDLTEPLQARLRVALYRDGEHLVEQAEEVLSLPAHGACERDVEELLGRFADASWAYRFGPPPHDVLAVSLERDDRRSGELLSQAFRFPAGRPLRQRAAEELGLEGTLHPRAQGMLALTLRSRTLAYGVRIHVPGYSSSDDALSLEPGVERELILDPEPHRRERGAPPSGWLTAINMRGRAQLAVAEPS
jgi:beta-mannosidase